MINETGRKFAIASLVLGIVSVVGWFFGVGAFVSIVCGIIGIYCAVRAKNEGYLDSMRTAGFVISIIGTIVGAIVFVYGVVALVFLSSLAAAFA